jgi:hypothetical protein
MVANEDKGCPDMRSRPFRNPSLRDLAVIPPLGYHLWVRVGMLLFVRLV